ncbi:hypothetical protein HY442_01170 [Candidatus Parcubacteria bacterium]|nr:hypothetical protein [Candidatus Parcubacteria bacterium]MBI4385299.1 hypothetical protein [Candidatus Parcubacteria bacterium]
MSDQEQQETQSSRTDIDLSGYLNAEAPAAPERHAWGAVKYYRETAAPKMVRWVMRYSGGIIKSELHATYVLLAFVVLAVAASVTILVLGLRDTRTSRPLPPEWKIIFPSGEPPRLEKPIRPSS